MTRKDYIALAAALVRSRPLVEKGAARDQWLRDVGSIARALAEDNSRFDQARFVDACREPKP
jgi:hypothetical protein